RPAPRGSAALCPHGPRRPLGSPRRPHSRRPPRRIVRRELQPRRRIEGHMGPEGGDVISRVADHCFWFGRYLERAESTARVLHVTGNLSLDAELTPEQCWLPVVIVSGEREHFFDEHGPDAACSGEVVQAYMTWDEDNLTAILR